MNSSAVMDGALAPPMTGAATDVIGSSIGFEHVSVAYKGHVVLDDFSLTIAPGEIMALLGPSGSGKTTALRAVAGFVQPVRGRVTIGAEDVTTTPPYARGIGMVVQNYALFPHMRVAENVAFGLRARGAPNDTVRERVRTCLTMVGMLDFMERYPRQLSGGQQQRVAIARALAIRPSVLLLDEPLSALDAQIRRNMVEELARLHHELPALTVLYVTHDQTEALTLGHRIAILRDGRRVAEGPSRGLYRYPPTRCAAEFLGRATRLPVEMEGLEADGRLARVRFNGSLLRAEVRSAPRPGTRCLLCIRPHDLDLRPPTGLVNTLDGRVQTALWQGDLLSIGMEVAGVQLRVASLPLAEPPQAGDALTVHFPAERASLIVGDGN